MATRISQPSEAGPGRARLEITPSRGLDPAQLEFALENNQGRCLLPTEGGGTAWGTTATWLPPAMAEATSDGIYLLLDTRYTWSLSAGATYRLRLRNRDGSSTVEERLAWTGIQMPATASPVEPATATPPPAPTPTRVPTPLPSPTPPPEPTPSPATTVPPSLQPQPSGRRRSWLLPLVAAVAFLLAAASGSWYWRATLVPSGQTLPDGAPTCPDAGVAAARRVTTQSADGSTLSTAGRCFLASGSRDAVQGALLLFTAAYDRGDAAAATAVGRMWDSEDFSSTRSPFAAPDPGKAELWYKRAADKNDAEGLYRLGHLLLSGRGSTIEGPEAGVGYLRKAADLGNQAARGELAKLKETK